MKSDKVIWIVEDDASAVFIYEDILKLRYQLKIFRELNPFVEALKSTSSLPDILITDLRLGEQSFLDFLTSEESIDYLKMPFIIVSSIDDLDVLRLCFDEGAVDYLTKPFVKTELLVKVERLLSRSASPKNSLQEVAQHPLADGEIVLDPYSLTLKRLPDRIVHLTAKELQIYSLFSRAYQKNEAVSRCDLMQEVWGNTNVASKSLDVHLFHLRKKLQVLGIKLDFKGRKGYSLKMPEEQKNE